MTAIGKKGDRITPAEVRAAYELAGIDPTRHVWLDDAYGERSCGCPATVVAAARSGSPTDYLACVRDYLSREHEDAAARAMGVTEDYLDGFVAGVDGEDRNVSEPLHDFEQGFLDGVAVRVAIWPAGGAA